MCLTFWDISAITIWKQGTYDLGLIIGFSNVNNCYKKSKPSADIRWFRVFTSYIALAIFFQKHNQNPPAKNSKNLVKFLNNVWCFFLQIYSINGLNALNKTRRRFRYLVTVENPTLS